MISRVNRSSESFPPEDAGLIRRNCMVGLRVIFGLFWAADAYLKWSLIEQGIDYQDLVSSAAEGQPSTVASWIRFWADIAKSTPGFPYVTAVAETLIAIFIIIGLFKLTSLAGIFFSFLIWSTAEAFGGVFTPGATDIGTAPPLHGHVRRAHSCSRRNATGGSYAALGHAKLNQLIYKSCKLVGLLPRVSSLQYTEKPHCPLACTPLYPLL